MSSTKDVGPKLRQPNRPNLKKKKCNTDTEESTHTRRAKYYNKSMY